MMRKYLSVAAMIIVYIALMILLTMGFGVIIQKVFLYFNEGTLNDLSSNNLLIYIILNRFSMLFAVIIPMFYMMKYWERTPLSDIGLSICGRGKDILWAMFTSIVIYAIGFGASLLLGAVRVVGVQLDITSLLLTWVLMLLVAITEEVAMRGFVLGRLLNVGVNRYWALFFSSLLFSVMHLANPSFSFFAFINIFLAGFLLGAAYVYTRNLWFAITLHLFWNWIQGPVLGYEVSGNKLGTTMLSLKISEDNIISGGAFGFEGSIICTVLMVVFTAIILKVASSRCVCAPSQCSTPAPAHADE